MIHSDEIPEDIRSSSEPKVTLVLPMAELASRLLKDATFGNSDDRVIVKAVLRAIDGEIAQALSGSTPPPSSHVAPAKHPIVSADRVYKVLKTYRDHGRFDWDHIGYICRDVAALATTEGKDNG